MLITPENVPLIILAFIWIIGAVLQDLKRREVDNIWNFTLIVFALGYRLAISIYLADYSFFINGMFGLAIFIVLGNVLYYGRVFAGGDAKLLMALGAVLPLSYNWIINFKIFIGFLFLFLIGGAIYVLIWAIILMMTHFNNFKKEFIKQIIFYKKIFYTFLILAIIWAIISLIFLQLALLSLSLTIILFPILLVFAKAIEEACMIKLTLPNEVTVGDWLYKDIKIGSKIIRANWEGVTPKQLKLIKKRCKKNILIKQGIPFTPGFLIGLIILLFLDFYKIFF